MTNEPSTTEDYANRTVLACDLEDGLGRLQRAIRMLTVCQEAVAPKSDALAAAVDAVSDCFNRVEDEVMGPFCNRERRKQD